TFRAVPMFGLIRRRRTTPFPVRVPPNRRYRMSRIALVAALALVAATTHAQDPAKKADPKAAAAMEAMMKHGTPGPEHKKLEPIVGSWTFVGKMYEDPGAPPTEFKGTAERKWILDGRFLLDETKADFGGMPFQGIGY